VLKKLPFCAVVSLAHLEVSKSPEGKIFEPIRALDASDPEAITLPYHFGALKPLGGTTLFDVYVLQPAMLLLKLLFPPFEETTPPQKEHFT